MINQSPLVFTDSQQKHSSVRPFTVPLYHHSTYSVVAERPDRWPGNYGDLIGVDRDHPVRYEHEIYDVFDQFLELR